ncbi:MAG: hypothetical protein AAFQ27_15450 [Pseudomonadota bacterium]
MIPFAASASAETREEYLARLKEICSVDCMQPRQFQRTARKRSKSNQQDMAVIMDVAYVRRAGDKFELLNINVETSHFDDLFNLEAAGIDVSGSTGVGALPRGRQGGRHPNLIAIEMDAQSLAELLNPPTPLRQDEAAADRDAEIVVEDEVEREMKPPTLATLRNLLVNRRIVVRGKPQLNVVLVGARRDFLRKQVSLQVANGDDLVLLPRYDKDGNPRPEDLPWLHANTRSD